MAKDKEWRSGVFELPRAGSANRSLSEQRRAESTFATLRAAGGPLLSACRKRNGKSATLSFIAATPGHGLQRLKEVDELSLLKRPIGPGIERPNKTSAIRDKAVHGIADTWVGVLAGINAILLSKTSDVPNLCYSRSHVGSKIVQHQAGRRPAWGFTLEACRKTLTACPAPWFCSANNSRSCGRAATSHRRGWESCATLTGSISAAL